MLLLIAGSPDGTADRIVSAYGSEVFRLNFDLWKDYHLALSPDGWSIENPAGLKITSKTVTRAFWWKAFNFWVAGEDKLISAEVRYIFREIYGSCVDKGIAKGNFIDWHNLRGKVHILRLAKQFFHIPKTLVTLNGSGTDSLNGLSLVAKSLSSELSNENTVMATVEVGLDRIDPSFPWYLQSKVDSDWDVTVLQCGNLLFPFRRSRKNLKGLDWRLEQSFDYSTKEWFPFEISKTDAKNIIKLSESIGVEFGRYDFLIDTSGNLLFLEFNANGQWVFLDVWNEYGLLDAVVGWIKS